MTSSLFLIPRPFVSEKEGRQRREEEADILARESLLWVSVDFGLERQNPGQTVTVRGVGRGHRGTPTELLISAETQPFILMSF